MPEVMQMVSQKLVDAMGIETVDEMLRKTLNVPIEAKVKISENCMETPEGIWIDMRSYWYQWESKTNA